MSFKNVPIITKDQIMIPFNNFLTVLGVYLFDFSSLFFCHYLLVYML